LTSEARKNRKREQQRQEILVSARELFLREGYARFSMRKLAGAVGCVPGTLYLYFRDKDELLATLVEESFEYLMAELEALREDADPLRVLKGIMRAYVDFGLANPNHYYFAFMLRRTRRLEEARPRPHRSYVLLRRTVAAGIERGLLRPIDLEVATQGVWTAMHGVTSLMISMPSFPWGDKNEVINHVLDSAVEGLLPAPPSAGDRRGRR
jgi:AcrR family transcriptional regulator